MSADTEKFRQLNDAFRQTFQGGQVQITSGVANLPEREVGQILELVRQFNDFSADNDPYQEHDFGAIDHADHKICFKVDY